MLEKIIAFSLKNKLIVVLFTLTIAVFGVFSVFHIPIGAVPDITNNQVQVITTSGNLSTQEIEQFITAPVELEMANLPGVTEIRSISKFGLSVVTIVFEDNMGTYLPRQLIAEKIKTAAANIPEGFGTPEMGPISTGLGEIYQYVLDTKPGYEDQYSPMELRSIQDWIVRRQLSGIKGVVEVNSWGGYLKQYEIAVDPSLLNSKGIALAEVFNALEANNSISGGAYIEKTNQSYFIRGDGQVKSLGDIENIVVKNTKGIPVLVKDIAKARFGYANRYGAITANGEGEKVLGQIMMLKDANSKEVINDVKERVAEVQKSLPEGVFINPILERSELISKTTHTVVENLLIGCLIVIFVVVLLLGNIRPALVIASVIPLALLFTISMMYVFGIDANLMSLGALDFGIIIDGAVIIIEFIAIRITSRKKELSKLEGEERQAVVDDITYKGASKMMNSAIFGQVIILIVFLPILSLKGVEGKMFRPMALSFSFAIIGAMILCFTWLPVAASLFIKPHKIKKLKITDQIMNLAYSTYTPVMRWSCNHKKIVLGTAIVVFGATVFIFSKMGGEFVPTLDEGDYVIQPVLKTGTSLSKTVELTTAMENILIKSFPEVDQIVCRIGAAEVPTDPMSMEEIDMIIKLRPKSEWVSADTKEELAELFKDSLSIIPGIEYEFTQPIEMRFNELITGVRADIAIKLFGEDIGYLDQKAQEIKSLIENVPGAADIILEKTVGLPQMNVHYNRSRIAQYGLDVKSLNNVLGMAFGGEVAGSIFEGEKRFDMVVRLDEAHRKDIENIKQLMVPLPNGEMLPFSQLAEISYAEGPAKISRDNTHRRVVVSVNVRNRDLQSVVHDIQEIVDGNLTLEPGYYIAYGGQFENLQNATKRLTYAVPLALALIFIFLHFAFQSFKDAILIFTAVPLSTVGGVLLLWIRGMPFSVSAGIGFIALFGIAVLNGIVLIEHLKELRFRGDAKSMQEIILKGTKDRLRPVMLTAAAAAMGFLPMAISTGAGAEVQRPLATVVIGGLVTSTMLTMIALPLLFEILYNVKGVQFWPLRFIRSKTLMIGLIFSFSILGLKAQDTTLTMDAAVKYALENNKELKSVALKVDESRTLVKTAFDIDKTNIFYGYDENNVAENGAPLKIIGVEQSFSFPTLYTAKRNAFLKKMEMAELEYNHYKEAISKEVSAAYLKVLYLKNKQKIFIHIDSLYQEFNKGIESSYQAGQINKLDYLNARFKKEEVENELVKVGEELKGAITQLQTKIQYEGELKLPDTEMPLLELEGNDLMQGCYIQKLEKQTAYQESLLAVEKNHFLPDISLSYFNGTNNLPNAKNYYGYEFGLTLPLFFGEKRASVNASKIAINISKNIQQQKVSDLKGSLAQLKSEYAKYKSAIDFYWETGKMLSEEIVKTAQLNFEVGEIDFFKFAVSTENALEMKLRYLEDYLQYNLVVLEINFLTH